MNSDFPRILTLLRKERGISQKNASTSLDISQALLSHYEKGIRECGLDFLVRCANFYDVSCDYLLGRSPDRQGSTITVEDIPDSEDMGKENRSVAAVLPVLNKKLISNSLNILFDLLTRAGNKALTSEVSSFLSVAVYRMFRVVYSANPKNQGEMFDVPYHVCGQYANAAMQVSEANAMSVAMGRPPHGVDGNIDSGALALSTEKINEAYVQFAPSLFNLIQSSEQRVDYREKSKIGRSKK